MQPAISPTPTPSNVRNSKFHEYYMKQCEMGVIGPAPLPVFTPVSSKLPKESAGRKSAPKEEGKGKSPKKQPERNQFGPVGHKYEKFWCCGCDKWLPGSKTNATNHLKKHHNDNECSIIHITNSGMLKVDKEDWLMDKATKRAKIEANDAMYNPSDSSFNSTLNSSNDSSFNNSSSSGSSFTDVSS